VAREVKRELVDTFQPAVEKREGGGDGAETLGERLRGFGIGAFYGGHRPSGIELAEGG